jgi:hypothetical protein
MSKVVRVIALIVLIALPLTAAAQDAHELARQTQNPVPNFIRVPFQGNWDVGIGDRETTGTDGRLARSIRYGVPLSTLTLSQPAEALGKFGKLALCTGSPVVRRAAGAANH